MKNPTSQAYKLPGPIIDAASVYVSGVASHFGFVSLPHLLGSSLCIFSIAFAVSGCFSVTCFVIAWTISFHDAADSFCSQGPPNDRHVIVFIRHLHPLYRCTVGVEGLIAGTAVTEALWDFWRCGGFARGGLGDHSRWGLRL